MIVDFHTHTLASDGTLSAPDLLARFAARGVEAFAITDHDSLEAYREIDVDPKRIVTGIEINTTYKGNEVHVLGYGVPLEESPIAEVIERNKRARRVRAERMVEQLAGAGFPLTMPMVLAEATDGATLGRPHVAKALARAGFVRNVDAAFKTVLARGGAGYVPSNHITPVEAVETIARSGGVPVLAHPGRLKDFSIIDELADRGLVGLEVFYPSHDARQTAHFRERARDLGLVMTAGSDFHDLEYSPEGVGIDVDEDDIIDFLDLVLDRWG